MTTNSAMIEYVPIEGIQLGDQAHDISSETDR